jgi:hypothetical protein
MTQQVQRAGRSASSLEVAKPTTGNTATTSDSTVWRAEALRVLGVLSRTGQPFTADTLLQLVGSPPHHKQLGTVFAHAKRARLIEPVSAAVSAEDGRLLRVWVRRPAA